MGGSDVTWHSSTLDRTDRWQALRSHGATLWFTGLSGAGKSTIAAELERRLVLAGLWAYRLDGDNLRQGLTADLGFSLEDRTENLRRVAEVAVLFADAGALCIASTISPMQAQRDAARHRHEKRNLAFFEVFISTPVAVCRQRDPKGLYAKADQGLIADFTGVSAPYEPPGDPDLTLPAHEISVEQACNQCLRFIAERGVADASVIESCLPRPSHGSSGQSR